MQKDSHVSSSRLNFTKYCTCHKKWLACFILVTFETSFTMRGATGVTIQPHQILRLPRKMTRLLNPRHTWNVIYNARSNRCHDPTSPNTACHAERLTYLVLITYEASFTMCGATGVPLQPHQILRLPRKMTFQNFWEKSLKTAETSFTMRGRSENDPTMVRK